MEKKMRGIADPFTLGLIIAILGSATASNLTDNHELSTVQSSDSDQVSHTALLASNEDEDE